MWTVGWCSTWLDYPNQFPDGVDYRVGEAAPGTTTTSLERPRSTEAAMTVSNPVRMALIGSGRMGSFHGETLAHRLPGARLVAVADPAPGAADRMAEALGADRAYPDAADVFADADV